MKKFFFFRSSTDKTASPDNAPGNRECDQWKNGVDGTSAFRTSHFETQQLASKNLDVDTGFGLRRSRTFSSAAFVGDTGEKTLSCWSDQSSSPSSSGSVKAPQHNLSSRFCTLTPNWHASTKHFPGVPLENDHGGQKPTVAHSFHASHDGSQISLHSSNDMSNEVLDLYIDGEQHSERGSLRSNISSTKHTRIRGGRKPPKVDCTVSVPGSPTDSIKEKPNIYSHRGDKGAERYRSCRDWVESEFGHESPQDLAKHVVEKLCQSRDYSRTNSNDHDPNVPITIEDVYGGSLNRLYRDETLKSNNPYNIKFSSDTVYTSTNGQHTGNSVFVDHNSHGNYDFSDNYVDVQSALEKELDRRSNDWSLKVEKYKAEEQRLRERVRELAEQNVALQREVLSFSEIETKRNNSLAFSKKQIHDLTSMLESTRKENEVLRQRNCELQDKCEMIEEDRARFQSNCGEQDKECKELRSGVSRLHRTCSDQEKTINGLRGELEELLHNNHSMELCDKHVQKLQKELTRLTGVEQALRREVESHKQGVDSLRHENVQLLERLKACGKEGGFLTFKLDEELAARLLCWDKQGLSLLNESIHLSSKLLEAMKRMGHSRGKKYGLEGNTSCFDVQFIIESDMKVQGFNRRTESLMRSLQNISAALQEKSGLVTPESQTENVDDDRYGLLNGRSSQNVTRVELKAEMLLTSLLRDKLYSKDQEVEHLQAELATAVRSNDILRCEVRNALDSLSSVTHKMKEFELQMIKKDDEINQLQSNLQESVKELSIIKGILPKITAERDLMWEEVKQYTEKNMLLDNQVNTLKKKIELLEEDILVKEGQITILKDSLGSKSFDLLASPDRTREFLLE